MEAVKRIDALFDIERGINGRSAEERLRMRKEQSAPLLAALEAWLREQRARLSTSSLVARPIDYMLRRWDRFARFIDDGRICLTNNAAERAARFCSRAQVLALRRLRAGRRPRRGHGDIDHDRKAQRRRSASLAGGCVGPYQRSRYPQARSASAVELGCGEGRS